MSDAPPSQGQPQPPHGLNAHPHQSAASGQQQQHEQAPSTPHNQQQSGMASRSNASAGNASGGADRPPPSAAAAPRSAPYSFTSIVDSFLQGFRNATAPPSPAADVAAPQQQQQLNLANATTQAAEPQSATLNAGVAAGAPATAPAPPHTPPVYGPERQQEEERREDEQRSQEQVETNDGQATAVGEAQTQEARAASPPAQLQPTEQDAHDQSQQQQQQREEQPDGEEVQPQTAQQEAAAAAPQGEAQPDAAQAADAPAPHLFRLPITDAQGRAGLLAFTPTALPPLPTGAPHELPAGGDATAYVPRTPIFVPLGASPLPFPFLFDAPTNTAWPILPMAIVLAQQPDLAAAATAANAEGPRFISGPPFLIQLDLHFAAPASVPAEAQPDPEAAAAFVEELETADAELRRRMARLELGDIGAGVGCAICLETYEEEDRPDWLDGAENVKAQRCVVVPCPGHHTLHLSCLRDWLANSPPDQWACPFCRAAILAPREERKQSGSPLRAGLARSAPQQQQQQKLTLIPARVRGLRDEVRARERLRQWRCDTPACLARYPDDEEDEDAASTTAGRTTELLKLRPCGHEHHLDCLCTSMKLEQGTIDEPSSDDDDASSSASEDEEEESAAPGAEPERAPGSPTLDRVGKWVVCPTCRIDAWAELPARSSRHSRRVRRAVERQEKLKLEKEKEAAAVGEGEMGA